MTIQKIKSMMYYVVIAFALSMAGLKQAHADSTTDIVNALVMKGVLTEEEGALLTKGHTGETAAAKKEKDSTVHSAGKMAIRGY